MTSSHSSEKRPVPPPRAPIHPHLDPLSFGMRMLRAPGNQVDEAQRRHREEQAMSREMGIGRHVTLALKDENVARFRQNRERYRPCPYCGGWQTEYDEEGNCTANAPCAAVLASGKKRSYGGSWYIWRAFMLPRAQFQRMNVQNYVPCRELWYVNTQASAQKRSIRTQ
jgi:hypothetical protein